jgi:hypothetical protein
MHQESAASSGAGRRLLGRATGGANALLHRAGVQIVRTGIGIGPRRIRASMKVFEACNHEVQAGPFKGLRLAPSFLWGDANIGAVVLGCYEQQLHGVIEDLVTADPDVVINVGSAEGVYAIGLARRLPTAQVIAVDVEPDAEAALRANAELNSVSDRVRFGLAWGPSEVEAALTGSRRPALVFDCEGCEFGLVDPEQVPSLRRAHLLVEVHEQAHPDILALLRSRLAATHRVAEITETGRNPHDYEVLRGMDSIDKWLVVCEGRGPTMTWIWAEPVDVGD